VTLYEILGVLPGASRQQIERACQAKLSLLAPGMTAGASSKVLKATDRARAAVNQAWSVLGDPAARARYDIQVGIKSPGTGLERPASVPSEPGWDLSPAGTRMPGVVALGALDALADLLAPHQGPSRRVVVPDVCGLFTGPGQRAVGQAGLRLEIVRLTPNPMPVEGVIVEQSPPKDAKVRRSAILTVHVWHPAALPSARR
jgi:hypothetical protein